MPKNPPTGTARDRDYKSFVESPSRGENYTAREVCIGNLQELTDALSGEYDVADGTVSAIKAIYRTVNGVAHGDKNINYETSSIIGISITGNTSGNKIKYRIDGRLDDSFFNFPLNDPLYLGNNGEITNTPPSTGHRTRLGTSLGVGSMQIEIEEPIIL